MDRWKAEMGRVREEKKKENQKRKRRKNFQVREKVVCFSNDLCLPEGGKVGSLKRRVRSQLARWEMKNCTPLWRETHFQVKGVKNWGVQRIFGRWDVEKVTPLWRHLQVKKLKTCQPRSTFGSCDVKKVHAGVARSTFPSQNVQNTPCSDHFWKLRCRKGARRCGAKHISKSKCTKHPMLGDVEKVHAVVARSTFRSQNVQSTTCSRHFWTLKRRFAWPAQGIVHLVKSE